MLSLRSGLHSVPFHFTSVEMTLGYDCIVCIFSTALTFLFQINFLNGSSTLTIIPNHHLYLIFSLQYAFLNLNFCIRKG